MRFILDICPDSDLKWIQFSNKIGTLTRTIKSGSFFIRIAIITVRISLYVSCCKQVFGGVFVS